MIKVAHVLSGLAIGGKERAALRLATRGNRDGQQHSLVLFDTPFRSMETDFHPGEVPVHFLPRGPGLDLRFARRLAALLKAMDAEVIHAHNASALVYASIAALLQGRSRPRILATFHSWPGGASQAARVLTRLAASGARTVAVSDELASRLLGAAWLGRCGVIWNGVDLSQFVPAGACGGWRERLGLGPRDILVGHVARFDPIKRHADLLQAALLLQRRAPEVVIAMVGQGSLQVEIHRQASGLRNLRFIPQVTAMPALMRSLDLLVLCSAHEAAPLVVLEAMACGVPVVATAVGGVPHLLGQDTVAPAGVLVPPLDPAALAGGIEHLARQPGERTRLAAAASRRAAAFSFDAEWSAYQALYFEAASQGEPAAGSVA